MAPRTKSTRATKARDITVCSVRIEGRRALASALSATVPNHAYLVTYGLGHETCECGDHIYRRRRCKHIMALMNRLRASKKGKALLRCRRRS